MSLEIFKREMALERTSSVLEDGIINLVPSSSDPVNFGSYNEVLLHDRDAVDTSTCTALLLNHDPDQIVGRITKIDVAGGRSIGSAVISKDAVAKSGPRVRDLVADGTLLGLSVSYTYDPASDASFDEKSRTLTVRKWRMLEVTLTPIPRDKSGHVARSLPAVFAARAVGSSTQNIPEKKMEPITLARLLELQKANPDHSIAIAERAAAGDPEAKILGWIEAEKARALAARDETSRAQEMANLRMERQINMLAESHGLSGAKYRSLGSMEKAIEAITKDKAEAAAVGQRGFGGREGVTVTNDEGDKFIAAATDALLSRTSVLTKRQDVNEALKTRSASVELIHPGRDDIARPYSELAVRDLGARNLSIQDIARRMAALNGEPDARDWDRARTADYIMRHSSMGWAQQLLKRSANQTSSMFQGLLANVMDKTLLLGFNAFEEITFTRWCRMRQVRDFKVFSSAALSVGNLTVTAEGAAFPELTAKDSSYSSALSMWGGTLSLTLQAIYDDDLGEFFNKLGQAGGIAKRTMDIEAYNQLMGFSYNALDVQTGAPLGTQDNLDKVRTLFRQKKNPAGQKTGNTPKFILHPFGLSRAAQQAIGVAAPPGEPSFLASQYVRTSMEAIEVPYLDDSTVNANASTTNYFMVGGPSVETVTAATLEGMQTPQVMEFDAGATAARKFKIFQPYVAVPGTYTDAAGNTGRLVGITKGTP